MIIECHLLGFLLEWGIVVLINSSIVVVVLIGSSIVVVVLISSSVVVVLIGTGVVVMLIGSGVVVMLIGSGVVVYDLAVAIGWLALIFIHQTVFHCVLEDWQLTILTIFIILVLSIIICIIIICIIICIIRMSMSIICIILIILICISLFILISLPIVHKCIPCSCSVVTHCNVLIADISLIAHLSVVLLGQNIIHTPPMPIVILFVFATLPILIILPIIIVPVACIWRVVTAADIVVAP